jgi:hypothetical protein
MTAALAVAVSAANAQIPMPANQSAAQGGGQETASHGT